MEQWGVFGVIAALVTFGVAVGTPLMKLNSSITKLNALVEFMQKQLDKFSCDNEKEHNTIWDEVEKHDGAINDHETRITVLERKEG